MGARPHRRPTGGAIEEAPNEGVVDPRRIIVVLGLIALPVFPAVETRCRSDRQRAAAHRSDRSRRPPAPQLPECNRGAVTAEPGQLVSQEHDTTGTVTIFDCPTASGSCACRTSRPAMARIFMWLSDQKLQSGTEGWFVFDDGQARGSRRAQREHWRPELRDSCRGRPRQVPERQYLVPAFQRLVLVPPSWCRSELFVLEHERHQDIHLIAGDLVIGDDDALLLDPGTADTSKGLDRSGYRHVHSVLERLLAGRADLGDSASVAAAVLQCGAGCRSQSAGRPRSLP